MIQLSFKSFIGLVFLVIITALSGLLANGVFNAKTSPKSHYQLYPFPNTMVLMDGNRVVGVLPYDSSKLSITVDKDNGGE